MSHRSGFSLVEVSLAMGILAFVVLAILGLLGVGMTSGRSAQTDTALTAATRFAVSSLQTNNPASVAGTSFWRSPISSSTASASATVRARRTGTI